MKYLVLFVSVLYGVSVFSLENVDKPTEKQQLNQIFRQHKEQQQSLHTKHQLEQQQLHKSQQQEQEKLQKKQQVELQEFQKQQLQLQQDILTHQQQMLNQQHQQLKEQEQEIQQQEQQQQQQQSEQGVESGNGAVSGPGTGSFCKMGKLNMVTYAASCFDNCSSIQVNFATCPNGKVCCSTVDAITKIVFGNSGRY